MKIIHLCLSCFYIDGYAYQENELVAQHVADGHEVMDVATTESYDHDRRLTYLRPADYIGSDGARVIRLPYRKGLPHAVMRKLRMHPNVYDLLEREQPDTILFHGLCGWELLAAAKYKRAHPGTKLYVDSHEDFNNSARSFISRHFLHLAFYRRIVHSSLNSIEKILCVSVDTINFVRDFYRVPPSLLEFFPLGGKTFDDTTYAAVRSQARSNYCVQPREIVFVQSGKLDRSKKILEALRAFISVQDDRFRFIIAGHFSDEIKVEAIALIASDTRITFVGWISPSELRSLLCAADVYVQPGSQSATMQMSLCCRCAAIIVDVPSHAPFLDRNGWALSDKFGLTDGFRAASALGEGLQIMSAQSAKVAHELLDYRILAHRLYR